MELHLSWGKQSCSRQKEECKYNKYPWGANPKSTQCQKYGKGHKYVWELSYSTNTHTFSYPLLLPSTNTITYTREVNMQFTAELQWLCVCVRVWAIASVITTTNEAFKNTLSVPHLRHLTVKLTTRRPKGTESKALIRLHYWAVSRCGWDDERWHESFLDKFWSLLEPSDFEPTFWGRGFELNKTGCLLWERIPVSSCQKLGPSYHHGLLLTTAACPSHTTAKCGVHWGAEACGLLCLCDNKASLKDALSDRTSYSVLQRRRNTLFRCSLLETRASTGVRCLKAAWLLWQ